RPAGGRVGGAVRRVRAGLGLAGVPVRRAPDLPVRAARRRRVPDGDEHVGRGDALPADLGGAAGGGGGRGRVGAGSRPGGAARDAAPDGRVVVRDARTGVDAGEGGPAERLPPAGGAGEPDL